jgi:hypothetical protein
LRVLQLIHQLGIVDDSIQPAPTVSWRINEVPRVAGKLPHACKGLRILQLRRCIAVGG